MSLSQDEWYAKIKKFVPSWWFEKEKLNVAVFQAIAAVFAQIQKDADDQQAQTFIASSSNPLLAVHGDERTLTQFSGESEDSFKKRVRNYVNQSDKPDIEALVNSLLMHGVCTILEGFKDLIFCNRGTFLSRNDFITTYHINSFTILVPKQATTPLSFTSRGYFANRAMYVADGLEANVLYTNIIKTVNAVKAMGVLYRIIEEDT